MAFRVAASVQEHDNFKNLVNWKKKASVVGKYSLSTSKFLDAA